MEMTIAQARVARGAMLLDRVMPGWETKMPMPERIDMSSSQACILGYAFGGYARGRRLLFDQALSAMGDGEADAVKHGFNVAPPHDVVTYNELFEAWTNEIQHRLWLAEQKMRPGAGVEQPIETVEASVTMEPVLV